MVTTMKQIEIGNQHIGIGRLGPISDPRITELRARQLSTFMGEIYDTVYEGELGLTATTERPFYLEDVSQLTGLIEQSNPLQDRKPYVEMVAAIKLHENGEPSEALAALVGMAIAVKPEGTCTADVHRPTTIFEINIAQAMYGQRLAHHLLATLVHMHADDPYVKAEVYQGNSRSIRFHEKLGFALDTSIQPFRSAMYEGEWLTLRAPGQTFKERLTELLG